MNTPPKVADTVHYVLANGACRPAFVILVNPDTGRSGECNLAVFCDPVADGEVVSGRLNAAMFFASGATWDELKKHLHHTWHRKEECTDAAE